MVEEQRNTILFNSVDAEENCMTRRELLDEMAMLKIRLEHATEENEVL